MTWNPQNYRGYIHQDKPSKVRTEDEFVRIRRNQRAAAREAAEAWADTPEKAKLVKHYRLA